MTTQFGQTLSYHEELECILWDVYKDAHGFRPRGMNMQDMTEEELLAEIARCEKVIEADIEEEKRMAPIYIADFEALVASTMNAKGCHRVEAIDILTDGESSDPHYVSFRFNLPHNYDCLKGEYKNV